MRLAIILSAAAAFAAPCTLSFAATVSPSQVSGIVAFGDSLTDAGNASIATLGAFPGPGYATRTVPGVPFPVGYYTNPQTNGGPAGLWVDQFAAKLGVSDPVPALAGGTNYAVGSALTGTANPQDMGNQLGLFLSAHPAGVSSSALYTFWGGANDIYAGGNPVTAADNIANEIKAVAANGGKNFLWFNQPALGDIPELSTNAAASAAADLAAAAFDAEWATDTSALDALGINVIGVDVAGLFNSILADPGKFGFSDVVHACDMTAGCDPNTFLYWDAEHPTTYTDSLVANLAYADLTGTAPTPEPSTLLMLGSALLGGAGALRRRPGRLARG